jgi:hypothetical protein
MEIDGWFGSYKVRSFPWIDGKRIYFNVQYYAPGQSIAQPPVWDKTIYLTDNAGAQKMLLSFKNTLIEYVAQMQISCRTEVVITVE